MGYYTDYKISTDPPVPGYELDNWGTLNKNGCSSECVKWYSHEADLSRASRETGSTFTVEGIGEEQPDIWCKVFTPDGKVKVWEFQGFELIMKHCAPVVREPCY